MRFKRKTEGRRGRSFAWWPVKVFPSYDTVWLGWYEWEEWYNGYYGYWSKHKYAEGWFEEMKRWGEG